MPDSSFQPEKIAHRETEAKTRHTLVTLSELNMVLEAFCHRGPNGLDEENVADLFDSLIMEGLQVPVEFSVNNEKRKVLTKGHRRVSACRILAHRNTPQFSLDMKIPAIEVFEASPKDLVVRAVMDNTKRRTLDNVARIRAALALHLNGVEDKRAAVALDVSEQSYRRDLLVGQHKWMFEYVLKNNIGPTHASQLLKAAVDAKRVDNLRNDLSAWVGAKEQEIQRKIKDRKDKGLRDLSDADKQVKSYLTGILVKHWTELLNAGKPFDEHAHWPFRAGFDPETRDLTIGNYRTNIDKEDPENLIRMVAQLSQVRNDIMPIVKKRAEEGKQPAQERRLQSPYDLDMLRREGLHDFADELEAELRAAQFGPRRAGDPGSENEDGQGVN